MWCFLGFECSSRSISVREGRDRMAQWWLLFVEVAGVVVVCGGVSSGTNATKEDQFDSTLRVLKRQCRRLYTPSCMQLEFLSQLERVLTTNNYEMIPGVFLSRSNVTSPSLPPMLADPRSIADSDEGARTLTPLVAERLFRQLGTWTLSVPVFGNSTMQQLRRMMHVYLSENQEVQEGRKSKFWKYMGPALITIAFSILSALISKSLTMSIIALVLTILGGRANFGFGSPPASSPAIAYRSPPPVRSHVTHSSELQYVDEVPDEGAQPYVYVNRKAWKMGRGNNDFGPYYYN